MHIAQLLMNAAALGAAYALVALGFALVLNATGAVNFAHGDSVVAGGLIAVALAPFLPALGTPGVLLLPLTMIAMALFGLILSWVAFRPLEGRPPAAMFISTIAVGKAASYAARSDCDFSKSRFVVAAATTSGSEPYSNNNSSNCWRCASSSPSSLTALSPRSADPRRTFSTSPPLSA